MERRSFEKSAGWFSPLALIGLIVQMTEQLQFSCAFHDPQHLESFSCDTQSHLDLLVMESWKFLRTNPEDNHFYHFRILNVDWFMNKIISKIKRKKLNTIYKILTKHFTKRKPGGLPELPSHYCQLSSIQFQHPTLPLLISSSSSFLSMSPSFLMSFLYKEPLFLGTIIASFLSLHG